MYITGFAIGVGAVRIESISLKDFSVGREIGISLSIANVGSLGTLFIAYLILLLLLRTGLTKAASEKVGGAIATDTVFFVRAIGEGDFGVVDLLV